MAFNIALVSAILVICASVLALHQVEGSETDFSGLQAVNDASKLTEHQVKAQELHAKMFEAALQEYQLHTNTIADKKVKEGISKALREYHAKTAHLVTANHELLSIPNAVKDKQQVQLHNVDGKPSTRAAFRDSEITRLTERKSDVNCNADTSKIQYNNDEYTAAPDKTAFSIGFSDPNNNGQNNNNGGQSSDYGYSSPNNNPSTAAAQKSSCPAQRAPAYQQTVALFLFAFVLVKWFDEDHI